MPGVEGTEMGADDDAFGINPPIVEIEKVSAPVDHHPILVCCPTASVEGVALTAHAVMLAAALEEGVLPSFPLHEIEKSADRESAPVEIELEVAWLVLGNPATAEDAPPNDWYKPVMVHESTTRPLLVQESVGATVAVEVAGMTMR